MVKNINDCTTTITDNLCGGAGSVKMMHMASKEDMFGKARLYAKLVIAPGNSVGYHTHHGDAEFYFILKGKAKYSDNGKESIIGPGDVTFTGDGDSHSIENIGDGDLEFIAFIPLK